VVPAAPPSLDATQLASAAATLQLERELLEKGLTHTLLPEDEAAVGDFIALQVEAAELTLEELDWRSLTPVNGLVPVELSLEVSGPYYNLPILVDGLFRQRRAVEITRLVVETPRLMAAHTEASLKLRFYRPRHLATSSLRESATLLTADPVAGLAALEEAAHIQILEAFGQRTEELERQSIRNRTQVRTALHGMIRQLPTSALGWVGMEVIDGEVRVLQDPSGIWSPAAP
jgi:hypothetical protein